MTHVKPIRRVRSRPSSYEVPYTSAMYIIAIGWIYVTLLMALTETNITAGILTFALYGLAPLSLLLWILGTPMRRRRLRQAEAVDNAVGDRDRGDTRADQ